MPDVMYLRKSRADMDAEAHGETDLLASHRWEIGQDRQRKRPARWSGALFQLSIITVILAAAPFVARLRNSHRPFPLRRPARRAA